jgi:hypothetical protein
MYTRCSAADGPDERAITTWALTRNLPNVLGAPTSRGVYADERGPVSAVRGREETKRTKGHGFGGEKSELLMEAMERKSAHASFSRVS